MPDLTPSPPPRPAVNASCYVVCSNLSVITKGTKIATDKNQDLHNVYDGTTLIKFSVFVPFATGSVLLKTKYLIHFPRTRSHFFGSFNEISQTLLGVRRSQFAVPWPIPLKTDHELGPTYRFPGAPTFQVNALAPLSITQASHAHRGTSSEQTYRQDPRRHFGLILPSAGVFHSVPTSYKPILPCNVRPVYT